MTKSFNRILVLGFYLCKNVHHKIHFERLQDFFVVVVAHIYPSVTGQRQTQTIGRSAHLSLHWLLRGWRIRTCLGVSGDPMLLCISSNCSPLNLVLVRSHQAKIIIVKRLLQGRSNVTRVRVEPRSWDQDHHKSDTLTHLATLPTVAWCCNVFANSGTECVN